MSTVEVTSSRTINMMMAINKALMDAMAEDSSVLMFGQDVGHLGGVFRVTSGLLDEFGSERVFDTPVSESGAVGAAIGMAMNGMRPIVELQFDAFAYPAFEQITSHLAKLRNRTRGRVQLPIVLRIPFGGGIGAVEHHSDSSESYYAHTPGLRVVTPSNPQDSYDLMRASIECMDPVVFLEPKQSYWSEGNLSLPRHNSSIDKASVTRSGGDVTLIAYGAMVPVALEAAEVSQELGWSVEVIDLRSLAPFDDATVCESVCRTGRAVVMHEAPEFLGYGAEVVARVTEQCFHYLHAPIIRVAGLDVPYPPPLLEGYYLPSVSRVIEAIRSLQWDDDEVEYA